MPARDIFAIWPPRHSTVSLLTGLGDIGAVIKVTLLPPPFPSDAARGDGIPIIVIPGYCTPNASTARLRQFLTRQGFVAVPWLSGVNYGPTKANLEKLEIQMAEMS